MTKTRRVKMKNKIHKAVVAAFAVVLLSSTMFSCATQQQRAQRKLARAIALDPSILKSTTHIKDSTVIRDSVRIKDSTTIIPKREVQFIIKADTNKRLAPFDFTDGIGPYKTRMWLDSAGNFHYWNKMDSVVNKNSQLEKVKEKQQQQIRIQKETITIIKYRVLMWQIGLAVVFGFFVAFLPKIFKWVLSKVSP